MINCIENVVPLLLTLISLCAHDFSGRSPCSTLQVQLTMHPVTSVGLAACVGNVSKQHPHGTRAHLVTTVPWLLQIQISMGYMAWMSPVSCCFFPWSSRIKNILVPSSNGTSRPVKNLMKSLACGLWNAK